MDATWADQKSQLLSASFAQQNPIHFLMVL